MVLHHHGDVITFWQIYTHKYVLICVGADQFLKCVHSEDSGQHVYTTFDHSDVIVVLYMVHQRLDNSTL